MSFTKFILLQIKLIKMYNKLGVDTGLNKKIKKLKCSDGETFWPKSLSLHCLKNRAVAVRVAGGPVPTTTQNKLEQVHSNVAIIPFLSL